MGVRSLTIRLAAEVAGVARSRRFASVELQAASQVVSGAGDRGRGPSGAAREETRSVPVERKRPECTPRLPELAACRPVQDARWKPPGGVVARFRVSRQCKTPDELRSIPIAHEDVPEPVPRSQEGGGNGTAQSPLPADSNADAITIELKSS